MTEVSMPAVLTAERQQRADEYFQIHLNGQREWYSKKASNYKKWGQILSIIVIASGALIPVVQLFPEDPHATWVTMLTAGLGLTVTLAKGIDRIGKFEESWVSFRKASESMKREYRLYINYAGAYVDAQNEALTYRRFVEQIEQIIAEEQQIFWQSQEVENDARNKSETTAGTD